MMLTTKARYAIIGIIEIAESKSSRPIRLCEISEKHGITIRYLEQIFMKLKNSGVVRAIKGPGGGYVLSTSLDSITLADIIDAVEENMIMTRCSHCKSYISKQIRCKTHNLWEGFGIHIKKYFQDISIADVINQTIVKTNV